jgi:hypothetical protein
LFVVVGDDLGADSSADFLEKSSSFRANSITGTGIATTAGSTALSWELALLSSLLSDFRFCDEAIDISPTLAEPGISLGLCRDDEVC